MIERLDSAASKGVNPEECVQYFCPPPTPDIDADLSNGDSYAPPPMPSAAQEPADIQKLSAVFKRDNLPLDYEDLALHFRVDSLGDALPRSDEVVPPVDAATESLEQTAATFAGDSSLDELVKPIDKAPRLRTPYPRVTIQKSETEQLIEELGEQLLQLDSISRQKGLQIESSDEPQPEHDQQPQLKSPKPEWTHWDYPLGLPIGITHGGIIREGMLCVVQHWHLHNPSTSVGNMEVVDNLGNV